MLIYSIFLFILMMGLFEKPDLTTICMRVCFRLEECRSKRNIPVTQLRSDHLADKNVLLR